MILSSEQTKQVTYSEEEQSYYAYLIQRLELARKNRELNHAQFNDMTYTEYYNSNEKAANSYIRPKVDEDDTRIVTGTTEEKDKSILATVLNYNLEPNIVAFNQDNQVLRELGTTAEALIKKSREIEDYDLKRELIYKELFDQGTCFVSEEWIEKICIRKDIEELDFSEGVKISGAKWQDRLEKVYAECSATLLKGLNVYLGNIYEFNLAKQPYLFTSEQIPYSQAKQIYGKWERFEYVPKTFTKMPTMSGDDNTFNLWYTVADVREGFVDVVKYQDQDNDEYMILLNGVMMLPIKFPLPWKYKKFSIAKGDVEPISQFFAYSKSYPAKTKVDQAVLDEFLKLIILKTRKSFTPAYANNTGQVLSKKILMPGKFTEGINPAQLIPIGDSNGVSNSEFATYQFVKSMIDSKTVHPSFEGAEPSGNPTATEIIELKKQSMVKLGLAMYGIISLEKQLAWLRLQNIFDNWTKKQDEKVDTAKGSLRNVYKKVTVEGDIDGRQGQKMIEFVDDYEDRTPESIYKEEEEMSKEYPVQKIYLKTDELLSIRKNFYITVNPTEKYSDQLDRVLFTQQVTEGYNLFGPQAFNTDYLKRQWALKNKHDPDKIFTPSNGPLIANGMSIPGNGEMSGDNLGQQIQSEMAKGQKAPVRMPSLNTLAAQ